MSTPPEVSVFAFLVSRLELADRAPAKIFNKRALQAVEALGLIGFLEEAFGRGARILLVDIIAQEFDGFSLEMLADQLFKPRLFINK